MLSDVLGLTPEQSDTYRALISLAPATAAELAESLGFGVGQVVRTLGTLESRGLAGHSHGDTTRFVACPPATLRALLIQRQNELKLAEVELDSLAEFYRAGALGRGVADVVDVIHGTEAVREHIGHMQLGAREEVLNLVKAPVISAGSLTDGAAIARGVRYRVILERAILGERATPFDNFVEARAAGEEVRIAEALPLKLFVVDREFAMVPLLGPAKDARGGALLVYESSLLDALIALFESEWGKVTQAVGSATAVQNGSAIEDLDAQILSLLLGGLTDSAIAAQLRISLRTVARRVRNLMDIAKVQTRMQLGFQVSRLGWLEAERDGSRAE